MTAKKEPANSNVNTNNNTNSNINNVHVHYPKRASIKKKEKPNWVLKTLVIAAIGFTLSLLGYYIKNSNSRGHNPAVIENGTPAITGEKAN